MRLICKNRIQSVYIHFKCNSANSLNCSEFAAVYSCELGSCELWVVSCNFEKLKDRKMSTGLDGNIIFKNEKYQKYLKSFIFPKIFGVLFFATHQLPNSRLATPQLTTRNLPTLKAILLSRGALHPIWWRYYRNPLLQIIIFKSSHISFKQKIDYLYLYKRIDFYSLVNQCN